MGSTTLSKTLFKPNKIYFFLIVAVKSLNLREVQIEAKGTEAIAGEEINQGQGTWISI